jgi:hypothetical protein
LDVVVLEVEVDRVLLGIFVELLLLVVEVLVESRAAAETAKLPGVETETLLGLGRAVVVLDKGLAAFTAVEGAPVVGGL